MFIIAIFLAFAGIVILAARLNERTPHWVAFIGGVCIIISVIMMYGAGVYSNAIEEGVEYTFVSRVDEEIVVYQTSKRFLSISPESKRLRTVKIIAEKDLQLGIQPGDTVVLTDNGIKKVLPGEEKSSTR